MAGLVGDPGAEPPGRRRIFELKKIAKNALFWPIFQSKFKKPALNFSAFGRKTIGLGISEKTLKFFDENSIEKFNFYLILWKSCC